MVVTLAGAELFLFGSNSDHIKQHADRAQQAPIPLSVRDIHGHCLLLHTDQAQVRWVGGVTAMLVGSSRRQCTRTVLPRDLDLTHTLT